MTIERKEIMPAELIAFAHGMANFGHNRAKKEDQERLIRDQLGASDNFLGAFEDSGNFAFITSRRLTALQDAVRQALNRKYQIEGVVVVERARIEKALGAATTSAQQRYRERFKKKDYAVWKGSDRYRLGLVFWDRKAEVDHATTRDLLALEDEALEVLIIQEGICGVLKLDPKKPRIPWGKPSGIVSHVIGKLATSRSAKTVSGILAKFR